MISALWVQGPLRPVGEVLYKALSKSARAAMKKGDSERAGRLARQAYRISPYPREFLPRLAKYLMLGIDPNSGHEHDHMGTNALLAEVTETDLPLLNEKYQRLTAFSLIRRRKPVPAPLLNSIAAHDDDDALIFTRLAVEPDVDVHGLTAPIFERHGLPVPPLVPEDTGIDRFGFPDCPSAHGDKVTVAMTTFNDERTIEHAIRSVINQTWRNLEIFVVDDASTDGTAAIIERYAAMDERIIPLHNPVNIGTYCSKNRALERATGRWFTCHDADDWSHPMKIERQVGALVRWDAIANTSQWIRSGLDFPVRLEERGAIVHRNHSSLIFQTDAIRESLGFFDSVRVSADGEMLERLRVRFAPHGFRDERAFLALGRIQPGTLTSAGRLVSRFRKFSEHRQVYKKNYLRWHRCSKSLYIPVKHEPRQFDAPQELLPCTPFERPPIEHCEESRGC